MSEKEVSGFVLLGYYLDLKWWVPSVPLELFSLGHQLNLGWIGDCWKIFKLTLFRLLSFLKKIYSELILED